MVEPSKEVTGPGGEGEHLQPLAGADTPELEHRGIGRGHGDATGLAGQIDP